jgi:hypothetical protein
MSADIHLHPFIPSFCDFAGPLKDSVSGSVSNVRRKSFPLEHRQGIAEVAKPQSRPAGFWCDRELKAVTYRNAGRWMAPMGPKGIPMHPYIVFKNNEAKNGTEVTDVKKKF